MTTYFLCSACRQRVEPGWRSCPSCESDLSLNLPLRKTKNKYGQIALGILGLSILHFSVSWISFAIMWGAGMGGGIETPVLNVLLEVLMVPHFLTDNARGNVIVMWGITSLIWGIGLYLLVRLVIHIKNDRLARAKAQPGSSADAATKQPRG